MAEIRVVHPDQREIEITSGAMTRVAGVSETLVGAKGIHLAVATIPPKCASSPHWHTNCESAIFITKGSGRFLVGDSLERELSSAQGDFIYVPPGAPHQPINDGDDPVEMVVARNAPVEIVEEYRIARTE